MRAYKPGSLCCNPEASFVAERQQAKQSRIELYISRQKAGLPLFDDKVKPVSKFKSARPS